MSEHDASFIIDGCNALAAALRILKRLQQPGSPKPSARSLAVAITHAETALLWAQKAHAECGVTVCRDGGAQ